MIERTLIALTLLIAGYIVYRLIQRRQLKQAASTIAIDPILGDCQPDVPTIVYFTTPTCAPCRLQQTPVFNTLQAEMGEDSLHVIRVDATQHPDTAERWGVFSVPTTFVLGKDGQPRSVHNGVVGLEKLKQELLAS